MKQLTIGIIAHVDAGKTTLSEAILYQTGAIRNAGRVDHKNTHLDTDPQERERGITIFTKQAPFTYKNCNFMLLDTPGHVDFSAETERTMHVCDGVILVINGTDGVQTHTRTLWRLLEHYHIPVFLFVNKMDISPLSENALQEDITAKLSERCIDFTDTAAPDFTENVALCDDTLFAAYDTAGKITREQLAQAISACRIFPVYFGSALKFTGIDALLAGFAEYLLPPDYKDDFAASVFKVTYDKRGTRLTHLKVTGGSLHSKMTVFGKDRTGAEWQEKTDRLLVLSGDKNTAVTTVSVGEICAVTGLTQTYPGEGLGTEPDCGTPILEPVLAYRITPTDNTPKHKLREILTKLSEEDPQLQIDYNPTKDELTIHLMGEIQKEILIRMLADRFSVNVCVDEGSIAYKETICETAEGVGHFEPLRHYAEVHVSISPAEPQTGVVIRTNCSEDLLERNFQHLIQTHLSEKQHKGTLIGAPITDVIITLVAGRAHAKHTEGGDFREATYRAVRNALMRGGCRLLEPWYEFRLTLPQNAVGRAMTDLEQMDAVFAPPETVAEGALITGTAPVSKIRGYHTKVIEYTRGEGSFMCTFFGYRPCSEQDAVVAQIGYNPLTDTENTADSVFCSHGAGFNVAWDHVEEYMHIPFQKDGNAAITDEPRQPIRRTTATSVSDAELMQIYENTYGKAKKNGKEKTVIRTKTLPPQVTLNLPEEPLKEYLLIDGYNIIFAWEALSVIAQKDLAHSRDMLIVITENYAACTDIQVILVFDAYRVKGSVGEVEKHGPITVIYTKEAETADMYIEKATRTLTRHGRVRVATSDHLEQIIILGGGAQRISAAAFQKEVESAANTMRDYLDTEKEKSKLGNKIGDTVT